MIDTSKYKNLPESKSLSGHMEIELDDINDFIELASKSENAFYRFKMPAGSVNYSENGEAKVVITYEKLLVLDIASGLFFSISQETGNKIPEKVLEEFGTIFADALSKKSPREIFIEEDKKIKDAIQKWLNDMNEIINPNSTYLNNAVKHVVDYIWADLKYPDALKFDLERYIRPYIESAQFVAEVGKRNEFREEFKKEERNKIAELLSNDDIYLSLKTRNLRENYIQNKLADDGIRFFTKRGDIPVIHDLIVNKTKEN